MSFGEPIRDFSGRIIAWEEHQGNDIIVREFTGRVLGRYDSQFNVTREFNGKVIAKGDVHGLLIALANKP